MRVAPLGILAAGNPERAARFAAVDAGLTHPDPACRAASAAFAAAIAAGIGGAGRGEMAATAAAWAGQGPGADAVRARIEAARRGPPVQRPGQSGWVLTAFQNAMHRLVTGAGFAEALVDTVAMGGDTDTNAAICGALLGAAEGRDAIPPDWRLAVLTARAVALPGVAHPRPAAFWPDDALALAEAVLGAGR
jgi:ADP-ribosylglycohydrolase